jgi:hypothetical protein
MPVLSNPRHEKFSQLVATGMSASAAYRQAGGTGKHGWIHLNEAIS